MLTGGTVRRRVTPGLPYLCGQDKGKKHDDYRDRSSRLVGKQPKVCKDGVTKACGLERSPFAFSWAMRAYSQLRNADTHPTPPNASSESCLSHDALTGVRFYISVQFLALRRTSLRPTPWRDIVFYTPALSSQHTRLRDRESEMTVKLDTVRSPPGLAYRHEEPSVTKACGGGPSWPMATKRERYGFFSVSSVSRGFEGGEAMPN